MSEWKSGFSNALLGTISSAASVLALGSISPLDSHLALAVNRFPSFEQFVVSGFPVSQYRNDLEARLKIEGERGLVLETDVNGAIIRGHGQFHVGHDLAFSLREVENAPVGNFLYSTGAGNFIDSHDRLVVGDFGQGRVRSEHRARPVTLISRLQCDSRTKSKLGHYQEFTLFDFSFPPSLSLPA